MKGYSNFKNVIRTHGRILIRDDAAIFGWSNSDMIVSFRGRRLEMILETGENEAINYPGLRVYYLRGEDSAAAAAANPYEMEFAGEVIVEPGVKKYIIAEFGDEDIYTVRVIKITEAGMSYVKLSEIISDGELIEALEYEDKRLRVEFIGDSITCGYGVHGASDAAYTVRDEDSELSYAGVLAKKMNLNAQWVSISGHGIFSEYTGNLMCTLPRMYPYKNWFYDRFEIEPGFDYHVDPDTNKKVCTDKDFEPEIIILNLGTNDSGAFTNALPEDEQLIRSGFEAEYEAFLYALRFVHRNAKIVCTIGTLAPGMVSIVEGVVRRVCEMGFQKLYFIGLPEHDVEHDGMASGHPSKATHEKDAERLGQFLENVVLN